jgi:hypothetical protein
MSMWNGRRNGNHRRVLALALLLSGGGLLHATDLAVSGNLSVSGTGAIQGSSLQLGTAAGTPTAPGLIFTYVDTDSTHDQIGFSADRLLTTWIWQYNNSGTWTPQMGLDATNTLTIYDRASTPNAAITLNPTGTSTFAQSLTGNGTNNLLPNQTLTGAGSILTEGLGDARYAPTSTFGVTFLPRYGWQPAGSNAPAVSLGGGSASAPFSLALTSGAAASGGYSVAIGYNSLASAQDTVAIGFGAQALGGGSTAIASSSWATGINSMTLASWSTASGTSSVTIGSNSTASGPFAITLGSQAVASGDFTVAGGPGTQAQGFGQFVVGAVNVAQGNGTTWVSTDDLFIVGNGTATYNLDNGALSNNSSSNAFAVKKNGETSVFGAKLNFGLVSGVTPGVAGSTGARLIYADGTAGAVTFSASKAASTWAWQNNDTATVKPQMSLSGSNVLTLYNSSGVAAIVLDPANPTAFTGISQTAADARYVSNTNVVVGSIFGSPLLQVGGTASAVEIGQNAQARQIQTVAIGSGAVASGGQASAIGYGATASGFMSSATAYDATASGSNSSANGIHSQATGDFTTANGGFSVANGSYATANAYNAIANGEYSVAAGANSTAAGFYQFVIGRYNAQQADTVANTWTATDDLFQIGNGTDATHTSNALTVKKNGDTTVNGALTATGTLTAAKLIVQHVDPQGDLDMGSFQSGQ